MPPSRHHAQHHSDPIHVPLEVIRLGRQLTAQPDLPSMFQLLARESAKLMGAESASVLLLDPERSELWSQVSVDGEVIRFDCRLGIAGAALSSGQLINVTDARHDDRFYTAIDAKTRKQTRTLLAVPLRASTGTIFGVLEVINKQRGAFTRSDEAIAQTLADHVAYPLESARLVQHLRQHQRAIEEENASLRREVTERFSTQNLIGNSLRMQNIIRLIDQVRDSSVDVLITGENGTGKELIAKAIHFNSPRAQQPFVPLNCAALPETLLETELFGIEEKIATDVKARKGKFEQAQGGTLFLDEIGDLGFPAQAKILRALQERVIDRVGGQKPIPVDVRVIAATNKDLEAAIQAQTFRMDLYYRLNVVRIQTPALREIPEDIPLLANYFLSKYCREFGKEEKKFSAGALRSLQYYSWPGNIRQLENEIKRLVVMLRRTIITADDVDAHIRTMAVPTPADPQPSGWSLPQAVSELEQKMIREALLVCHNNQVQTAKRLGLSRQGLIKKMKRYGICGS
ncbi:MAG: sigma-54-dependent Fis family transcriptional regulator [Nitrospirae bacterium]|nr:MAG: sigma-54-dependent Fis family transcriptional regulator [Nitrospirota bacterium]